jgi:phthalate 4,5-cis-dihydrodiol dehydrogenase
MLQNWRYVDWLYQPRTQEELAPGWGSGLLWRQGPHQFDLLRTIGGGLVRSLRGSTLNLDQKRGVDGAYTAFLEFEDGTACSAMCSGYDHFDSRHLVGGFDGKAALAEPGRHARARAKLAAHDAAWEEAQAAGERYGGGTGGDGGNSSGWLVRGPLLASFEGADVRFSRAGLIVDGNDAQREIDLSAGGDGRDGRLVTFYRSIAEGRPLPADGKWGKATQEVLVAMEQSSKARAEIRLEHQTAYVDQGWEPGRKENADQGTE